MANDAEKKKARDIVAVLQTIRVCLQKVDYLLEKALLAAEAIAGSDDREKEKSDEEK